MRASSLTADDLAAYLRIMPEDLDDAERLMLEGFLDAAKHYAESYTGLSMEELDRHPDITPAVCCLAGDFYTNRDMTPTIKSTVNRTVKSILDMYSVNLL
jgi:hypothetical protein